MVCGHDKVHQFFLVQVMSSTYHRWPQRQYLVSVNVHRCVKFDPPGHLLLFPLVCQPSAVIVQRHPRGIQRHRYGMGFRTDVPLAEGQETFVRTDVQFQGVTPVVQLRETYRSQSLWYDEMVDDSRHHAITGLQNGPQNDDPCDKCVTEHERMSDLPVDHPPDIIGICRILIEIEQFPSELSHSFRIQSTISFRSLYISIMPTALSAVPHHCWMLTQSWVGDDIFSHFLRSERPLLSTSYVIWLFN